MHTFLCKAKSPLNALKSLCLVFVILVSSITNVEAQYFSPYKFSNIEINIPQTSLIKYYKLLDQIKSNPASTIDETVKSQKLKGRISWYQSGPDNSTVQRSADIHFRYTGDWTDHVGSSTSGDFSSIKVEMIDDNFAGIIEFRLLRYKTRNLDEVTTSLFLELLGYPVPYRGAMEVKINGSKQFMIFEEAPVKEFIERFGLREAPIIEGNERQLWYNRSLNNHPRCLGTFSDNKCEIGVDPNILFGKIDNKAFVKNIVALEIGNDALISHKLLLDDIRDASESSAAEIKVYKEIVNKIAPHSMVPHNFKSIYDPIYKKSLPIFFDGNVDLSRLDVNYDKGCFEILFTKELSLDTKQFFEVFEDEYVERVGQQLFENQKCFVIQAYGKVRTYLGEDFYPRNAFYRQDWAINYSVLNREYDSSISDFDLFTQYALGDADYLDGITMLGERYFNKGLVKVYFITTNTDKNVKPVSCYYILEKKRIVDCGEVSFKKIRNAIAGRKKSPKFDGYKLYAVYLPRLINSKGKIVRDQFQLSDDKQLKITVPKDTTIVINQDIMDYSIEFSMEDPYSSRVLFLGSNIQNSKIELTTKNKFLDGMQDNMAARFDNNHLTGCITFVDVRMVDLFIKAQSLRCEDSINLIRVEASELNIEINDAVADALDADASKIDFSTIKISDALNDCVDFSYGDYTVNEFNLNNCGDKGISIGERSKLSFNAAKIVRSNMAIAVKDGAMLDLNKSHLNVEDYNICISTYKKKQEFDKPLILNFDRSQISPECEVKNAEN